MSSLACRLRFPLAHFELDLELTVAPGATVLLGPNGSGKSTLLRLLAGLNRPASGQIRLGAHCLFDSRQKIDIPPEKRRIGMVFQDLALFPHLDVSGNVGYGLRLRGLSRAQQEKSIHRLLDKLGIRHLAARRITYLSGGEQQKVALARTLATDPQLLLLDEPTAALDPSARGEIRRWLQTVLAELNVPTLLVTHNIEDVACFRKRIAVMEQGHVIQQGSFHQLLREPASEFIARCLGVNYIPGEILQEQGKLVFRSRGGSRFLAPLEKAVAGAGCMTVYPWDIALYHDLPEGSPRNHLYGQVHDVVQLGDRVRVTLENGDKLVAELSSRGYQALGEPQPGVRLWAVFKAREARIDNDQERPC